MIGRGGPRLAVNRAREASNEGSNSHPEARRRRGQVRLQPCIPCVSPYHTASLWDTRPGRKGPSKRRTVIAAPDPPGHQGTTRRPIASEAAGAARGIGGERMKYARVGAVLTVAAVLVGACSSSSS